MIRRHALGLGSILIILVVLSLTFSIGSMAWNATRAFKKSLSQRQHQPPRNLQRSDYIAFPLLLGATVLYRIASREGRTAWQSAWVVVATLAAVSILLAVSGVQWVVIVWLLGALYLLHLFGSRPGFGSYTWAYPYWSGIAFIYFLNYSARYRSVSSAIVLGCAHLLIYAILRYIIWRCGSKNMDGKGFSCKTGLS